MELHPATRGFDSAAERYERGRPGYPAAAIDRLLAELGLAAGSGADVADVGAGTGKLTRALLERGLRVIAVEPVDGMRTQLARAAPGADVRAGRAESLPLEDDSVDGVAVAQAFHWFASAATLAEFARVLRPDGRLGLIWNRRDLDQPLQAAIGRLLAPHRGGTPAYAGDEWKGAFTPGGPFELVAEHRIAHAQVLDENGLVDRVLSISFIAALPPADSRTVEARVRELAADAPVELRYVSELFVYARRG